MLAATMVVATIPVSDLEQAKHFYGEILGLTQLWENPASVRYRCGEHSELSVFKRPALATVHTLAHFEVDDIEAAVADLEAKGVTFLDYTRRTTHHYGSHRPTRPRTRRMVYRPRRQHPRPTAGLTLYFQRWTC